METDKKHLKLSNYRVPLPSELQSLKTARTRPTFSRQGEKTSATLKGETAVSRRRRPPNIRPRGETPALAARELTFWPGSPRQQAE